MKNLPLVTFIPEGKGLCPFLPAMTLARSLSMKFIKDTAAVTALEYGIIAGVLGLVLVGIFTKFSGHLSALFSTIGKSI